MSGFESDRHGICSLLLPGDMPPTQALADRLRSRGFSAAPTTFENASWALELTHPRLGPATLMALTGAPLPHAELIECTIGPTDEEKKAILGAGHSLQLVTPAETGRVLRDRKTMLRYGADIMGAAGLAIADHASELFWSPTMLEDELCHDADLDITGVFVTHAVSRESDRKPGRDADGEDAERDVYWLHTHGLAELGRFDFDILNPSEDLLDLAYEAVRAAAFAIVEGTAEQGEPRLILGGPRCVVSLVRADVFNTRAARAHKELRDHDENHSADRVVLCDPPSPLRRRPRPSRFLSKPMREGTIFHFSNAATGLMAARARNTIGVFRKLHEEMGEFGFPFLVKLGYETDGSDSLDNSEHLWFTVHGVNDSSIDATLENQPHCISRMNAGDRAEHDLERLSDWTIFTPLGPISPRSLRVARTLRSDPEKVKEIVAFMRTMGMMG